MADFFAWEDRYDLKVDAMNGEHKILINKMNQLHASWEAQGEDVPERFQDLAAYAVQHFEEEEKYMESIGFPELGVHKQIHKGLLEKVTGYGEQLSEKGQLPGEFFDFLKIWLASHICGIDMKYGEHANK